MGIFFQKKVSKKYLEATNSLKLLVNLYEKDKYISFSEYEKSYESVVKFISELERYENENILKSWCKENGVKTKDIEFIKSEIKAYEGKIKKHNDDFINRKLVEHKDYFDNILKDDDPNILLDEEQRKVVLCDENNILVIAGAGAGKTTTIEAKAKYLVEKMGVDPSKILIISFTNKATNELKHRFKKLGIACEITTFHSLGNALIYNNFGPHQIADGGYTYNRLKEFFEEQATDSEFISKINLFFASYLIQTDEFSKNELMFKEHLSRNEFETLKSEIENFKNRLTKQKRTFNNEVVKSNEECAIANFLFINGIKYKYEDIYPYNFDNSTSFYHPDFTIIQDGKTAYIEHFGVSDNYKSNRYSEIELKKYIKNIHDKELLHKEHGTTLIKTFSRYKDGRTTIEHLKEELSKNGFFLNEISQDEIYKAILLQAKEKYFYRLIALITNFIHNFKVNCFTPSKFEEFVTTAIFNKDERSKLFLEIARRAYLYYENCLKKDKRIDFQDMINNASLSIDELIKQNKKLPYKYIIIDEYQDISKQRFNLVERLSKCSDAKILAVGDDWQSIYHFSGSDIGLFMEFQEYRKHSEVLYLTKTYRNSQELIDIAGSFVMANDKQYKKSLKSDKKIKHPIIICSYKNKTSRTNTENDQVSQFEKQLDIIFNYISRRNKKSKVLLIGRYNFDRSQFLKRTNSFYEENEKIYWSKNKSISISFLTAHSSKGLTYDEVVLINGNGGILGFPSKIEDDPVMKFVLKDSKEIEYAEERRLFYVAITRTKNRVYILVQNDNPSRFILELKEHYKSIPIIGPELSKERVSQRLTCPYCGYPLQIKSSRFEDNYSEKHPSKKQKIYVCTNDPEICGFETNEIAGGELSISKCPKCTTGYLVVKKSKERNDYFLGCTNYKKDGNGCNCTISKEDFIFNNQELISRNKRIYYAGNTKLPLDKCILCGKKIVSLFKYINYVINEVPKEIKFKSFNFSKLSAVDFMIGNLSNPITAFKLNENPNFGLIDSSHKETLTKLFEIFEVTDQIQFYDDSAYKHYKKSLINASDKDFAYMIYENFVK